MMPPREGPSMERRGSRLSRRAFVRGAGMAGLGLLAGCGRLPGQAPRRIPRVGYLRAARGTAGNQAVFIEALRDLGYVDGHTVVLEHRVADGRADLLATYVDELVRLPVDIIVAVGS